MLFAKYLLATAAVEMLGELPQITLFRRLHKRARRVRVDRMRAIHKWHMAELKRLDPAEDPKRWFYHRAELRRWKNAYLEHAYQDQMNVFAVEG